MKKTLLLSVILLGSMGLKAQLFVDTSYTANQMIETFFGNSGVTVLNATYSGMGGSLAFFEGSQSNIGINAGLMMCSGQAAEAVGPNISGSTGSVMGSNGVSWLTALSNNTTYDGAVIEMDIVPSTDTLAFRYVFASEEYQEYVGTPFNDIFAFLVEGPGLPTGDSTYIGPVTVVNPVNNCFICVDTVLITVDTFCYFDQFLGMDTCIIWSDTAFSWCYTDPNCVPQFDTTYFPGYWVQSPGGINIAQIPNTNLPVAINTLNQNAYSQYFVANEPGTTVEYDGFTTPLWATLIVQAGQTYHVRLGIADASDAVFDSGVFIGIESLGGDSLLAVDPEFLVAPQSTSTEVVFQNNTLWATSMVWDFGDGTTSTEKNPTHDYAVPGAYTVTLTAKNWCSQKEYTEKVFAGVSATQNPEASDIFRVSPNPAAGSVIVDLQRDASAQVRLYRADGKLLIDNEMTDGSRINLQPYGKGIFWIQVVSNGKIYMEKIVNL